MSKRALEATATTSLASMGKGMAGVFGGLGGRGRGRSGAGFRGRGRRGRRRPGRGGRWRAGARKNGYLYGLLEGGVLGQIDSCTQRWRRFGEVQDGLFTCAVRNAIPFPI